jgi:N-acetylglutamate synthase-like GNAT family acetyltransferase
MKQSASIFPFHFFYSQYICGMITNPNIFIAKTGDIPELVLLINKAYKGEGSKKAWTSESNLFDGLRTNENVLTELLSDENAIIFKYVNDSGAIIGCVYMQKQESQIYLGLLSVSPDIQAASVGKQLLIAAEEYAQEKKCNKIVMSVITIRHELVEWYKRRGYYPTGVKPFPQDKVNIPNQKLELVMLEKKI